MEYDHWTTTAYLTFDGNVLRDMKISEAEVHSLATELMEAVLFFPIVCHVEYKKDLKLLRLPYKGHKLNPKRDGTIVEHGTKGKGKASKGGGSSNPKTRWSGNAGYSGAGDSSSSVKFSRDRDRDRDDGRYDKRR